MNHLFRKTGILILAASVAAGGPGVLYARAEETTETVQDIQQTGNAEKTEDIKKADLAKETEYAAVSAAKAAMAEIAVGETQRVTIQTTDDTAGVSEAFIEVYSKNRDIVEKYSVSEIRENEFVFDIPAEKDDADDDFVVTKLIIARGGTEQEISLAEYRADLSYAVLPTGSDGTPVSGSVSFFGEDEEKLAGKNSDDGKFVVVLDPGHDPVCKERAPVNGVWEPELNWIISDAMKTELEKYNAEVYINRYWEECPGKTDLDNMAKCVTARAHRGDKLDADLFVSLHNNAAGMGQLQNSAKGSTVYVTQYGAYHDQSVVLANMVMDKLAELGISKRGVETRDWGSGGGTYDDGTHWDYYAVIRESSLNHIPSILIEHAFMDNPTDLAFLKDREMLKKMGQKDAEAIVEYYGLEKGGGDGSGQEDGGEDQRAQVEGFVRRLYELVLGREADEAGLKAWTDQLIKKNNTGAEAAYGFVFSDEFKEKKLSDKEYVDILYRTCLNREADENGAAAWIELLKVPFSREYVLRGFIESAEFTKICESYGIERGSIVLTEPRDKNDGATRFVARCYNVFLDRAADVDGLNAWTKVILADKEEARNVPYGFVFSDEMNKKNLSDEAFVRILYEGILDRTPDNQGVAEWVEVIENGESREHVFEGFVRSPEFTELLNDYGL